MPPDQSDDAVQSPRSRTRARLGTHFRRQREALDKTLKQVEADLKDAGFSASMLSRIENGETALELDQILKLCSYYGLDPTHVCGLEDAPYTIYRREVIAEQYEGAIRVIVKRVGERHNSLVAKGIYRYLEFDPKLVSHEDKTGDAPHQLMSVLMLQVNRANTDTIIKSLQDQESSHESDELWYIIEGEVEFFYAQGSAAAHDGPKDESNIRKHTLGPGDSLYLSARGHHAVRATGEKPARVIVVIADYPLLTKRQIERNSTANQEGQERS